MSEVEARPPPTRGRSSYRGGRGGFGRGGPRGGRKAVNGTTADPTQIEEPVEDQGELGEMKKQYASELGMLKDMFPDWTDVDLVFALQETDGDVPATVDHITQGSVSQFSEVKSTKDRARSKVKEASTSAGSTEKPMRGGRGRGGFEGARGARGRGSDRGRGGSRGGRGAHATTNGALKDATAASVPTTESAAWGDTNSISTAEGSWDTPTAEAAKDAGQSQWSDAVTAETTPATALEGVKSSLIPEGGPKKSWASMLAPKSAPAPAKQPPIQQPPAELAASGQVPPQPARKVEEAQAIEPLPPAPTIQEPPVEATMASGEGYSPADQPPSSADGEDLILTPSKDPLTEENVEHLPDESHPPVTATAASTTGSIDPRNLTPMPSQQAPIARPPMGGYATSAYRATGQPGRSASYQRRVQEQQEAVVMPGHNAVDRAAVQFGSMGLNGEPGSDVDEDREEPETRQAPQHSPPSLPKTSLPPPPRQTQAPQEAIMSESLPTLKQAPGLPPASQQNQQQMQEPALPPGIANDPAQMAQNYNQYARYAQSSMQPEPVMQEQKPYDPFSHQAQPSQFDQYAAHPQQAPQQQQSQGDFGGHSSAPHEYSQYYTADQQRQAYSSYYGSSYGPQDARGHGGQGQQDAGLGQQRSASGFGAGGNEQSAFPSQVQQQVQSRFADATGSGNNTPNQLMGGQQQQQTVPNAQQQSQHSAHQAQSHQQQGGYGQGAYPYGHPYYPSPYQQAYQNQFGYQPPQQQVGGYGAGGYPSKHSGMYGQSHGYGMGPQSSYDQHSASPANAASFGQNQQATMRSASGMSAGLGNLDDYGRSSAQQSAAHQQSTGFGGMNDAFTRSTSGFGGQSGYGQQSMAGPEDSLKPYADNKGGPSPALGQPGGRPGSAANSTGGTFQAGLPPPQSHQQSGFGGYPGFPGQSGYGGLGGLGSQQHGQQQSTMGGQGGYGSYGAGGFGQTYGSYNSRGGWGSQYGH